MGEVYQAMDTEMGHDVALKVLSKIHSDRVAYFDNEFLTLAKLKHPYLAEVYDFGCIEVDGSERRYFTMELVDGINIERFCHHKQTADVTACSQLAFQILEALAYIHSRKIIHGDIKPSNILVHQTDTAQESVKLIDFGLSHSANLFKEYDAISGTIEYISPERIQGLTIDRRSDIYSLGVVLYELLAGKCPFTGKPASILTQHLQKQPPPITALNPNVTPRLEKVIFRMLQKEPARRYQNTQEVMKDLGEASEIKVPGESRKVIESYILSGRFIGRETALNRLQSIILEQPVTPGGQVILVTGETGVGKSRLVREFKHFLQTHKTLFLSYTCYEDNAFEYRPFIEILRQMVKWSESFAPELFADYGAGLSPLLPEFFQLGETERKGGFTPTDRIRLLEAILQFSFKLSERTPFVVFIDDFQWADDGSIEALRYFARNIQDHPILIVINLNSDEPRSNTLIQLFKTIERVGVLPLYNFDRGQVQQLVTSMLGVEEIPQALLEHLVEHTSGNPLFIEEYMKSIADEGLLYRQNNAWEFQLDEIDRIRVQRLDDIIEKRLQRLTVKQYEILKIFAVANRSLSFEIIAQVGDFKAETLQDILLSLQDDKVLYQEWLEDRIKYTLCHNKFRSLVYQQMEDHEKTELHLRLAQAIEKFSRESLQPAVEYYKNAEHLAHHYRQGGHTDLAITYLMKAGEKSRSLFAIPAAMKSYLDALSLMESESESQKYTMEKLRAHEALGDLYQLQGLHEKAIEQYGYMYQLAEKVNDYESEGHALENIGQINILLGHTSAAMTNLHNAVSIFREHNHSSGVAAVLLLIGDAYAATGDFEEALTYYENARVLWEKEPNPDRMAECYNHIAVIHANRGDYDKALEYHQKSLALRGDTGDTSGLSISHLNLGELLLNTGDYEQAQEHYLKALQLKQQYGDKPGEASALRGIGIVYSRLGQYDLAQQYFEKSLAIEKRIDNPVGLALTYHCQAELEINSGYYDSAITSYERAMSIINESSNRKLQSTILHRQGRLFHLLGDDHVARQRMEAALDLAIKIQYPQQMAEIKSYLGYIRYINGETHEGFALMEEGSAAAHSMANIWLICECDYLKAYGLIHQRQYKPGFQLCRELIELCERINNLEYNTKLLLLMAHAFMNLEQWPDALECVNRAASISQSLRMPYLEMKIENYFSQIHFQTGRLEDAKNHAAHFSGIIDQIFLHMPAEFHASYTHSKSTHERIDFGLSRKTSQRFEERSRLQQEVAAAHEILQETIDRMDAVHAVSTKEFQAIYDMAQTINSILDLDLLLEKIMDLVIETVHAERGMIFLKEQDAWKVHVARNMSKENIQNVTEVSHSIIENVSATGKAIFSIDARDDYRFKDKKSIVQLDIVSFMCIPLKIKSESLGVVYVDNRNMVGRFNQKNLDFLSLFANLAGIAIENARLHARLFDENIKLKEENIQLKNEITRQFEIETNIKGNSEPIRKVLSLIKIATKVNSNVLIEGESGTGKELVARAIHFNSARNHAKFVPVNCGALTETLLESELFGHKRGSFSGAMADKKGLFEEAEGGTIFLDEITNTTRNMQAKLLRVLQDGEFRRVGDTVIRKVDVRIISATNLDLWNEVKNGNFREDLFYRLKVIYIKTPPLRERKDDIILLANHFLSELNRSEKQFKKLSSHALELLLAHSWPGNVRELRNKIEQAYAISESALITEQGFPELMLIEKRKDRVSAGLLKDRIDQIERRILIEELNKFQWNIQKTAMNLGLSRRSLYDKLEKYEIKRQDNQPHETNG